MGRTVLITGASRGIGRAAALLFAGQGYNVVVNYRASRAQAEELCAQIEKKGGSALALGADVSDRAAVEAMVEAAIGHFGRIDVLVNNAGIAGQQLFTDITEAEWDRMFAVDVKGMFHCCKAVLPGMIHRKEGQIVNVSSIWGITGASCEVHYSAAKAAVIGLTKALAKELGPSNIRVNCVAPGVIDTEMNAALAQEDRSALADETPLSRIGSPEEAAQAILFLAGEQSSFITGQILSPNGGFVI